MHCRVQYSLRATTVNRLLDNNSTQCLKKVGHLYFTITQAIVDQLLFFSNVKFRNYLWRKLELKLPFPLKSVAALYLAKRKWSTIHLLTFILVRIICFVLGGICFMSFYVFIYFCS